MYRGRGGYDGRGGGRGGRGGRYAGEFHNRRDNRGRGPGGEQGYHGGRGGGGGGSHNRRDERPHDNRRGDHNRHGGGGPGRGGRGGRGRGYDNIPRPTVCNVLTNLTSLKVNNPERPNFDWVFYRVEIHDAKLVEKKSEDGTPLLDDEGKPMKEFVPDLDKWAMGGEDSKARFLRGRKPWRIMKKLVSDEKAKDPKFVLDYDGAELAVAPSGYSIPSHGARYQVVVKTDCEEDDPDKDRIKNRRYFVAFSRTHVIPFSEVYNAMQGKEVGCEMKQQLETAFNLLLNSTAIQSGMLNLSSSSKLAFPLNCQERMYLHQGTNGVPKASNGTKILLQGISQTSLLLNSEQQDNAPMKGMALLTDTFVSWADMERDDEGHRVKLLQKTSPGYSIAGVDVGDIRRRPITDLRTRKAVENAIFKLSLNVDHERNNNEREEEWRQKGVPGEKIEARRRRILKDKKMCTDRNEGMERCIIWSPNDPEEYVFEVDGQMKTICQHFKDRNGITLEYPNAPAVYLGRGIGYIPIEFIFQNFKKTKEANEVDMVKQALDHFDRISGSALISDIMNKRQLLSDEDEMNASQRLALYNLRITSDPMKFRTKILSQPTINFGGDKTATANNGSFNQWGAPFERPAVMNSYMVIDFNQDPKLCNEFITGVFSTLKERGFQIPTAVDEISLSAVTETYKGKGDAVVDNALEVIESAIHKAHDVYVNDSTDSFKKNQTWFKTQCLDSDSKVLDCIVLPPLQKGGKAGLLIYYDDTCVNYKYSHSITTKSGTLNARLMAKISGESLLVDLLYLRYHNEHFQRMESSGEWTDANLEGYCFLCEDGTQVEMKTVSFTYRHSAEEFKINCPSIIFVIKPDDKADLFDEIKAVTNLCGGYLTQVVVAPKYSNSGNKDSYLSSISILINNKLNTAADKAASWHTNIDWIGDKPTLIIGFGTASGMGNSSETVVSASTVLDCKNAMGIFNSCFIQDKSCNIADHVMERIVEEGWRNFCSYKGDIPERAIFYRDGLSDNNFSQADDEIACIRRVLNELNGQGLYIPITYIICQSHHTYRMVPDTAKDGMRGNVYSGTILDHSIMDLGTKMNGLSIDEETRNTFMHRCHHFFENVEDSCDDFLLTAHGGLNGTSKPVYYRVRLNENKIWGPAGATPLTKETLYKCTFEMSFAYASATKATREVPVIKYAKKLSNQVLRELKLLPVTLNGETYTLHVPDELDSPRRYYIEVKDMNGDVIYQNENIADGLQGVRNHLAL